MFFFIYFYYHDYDYHFLSQTRCDSGGEGGDLRRTCASVGDNQGMPGSFPALSSSVVYRDYYSGGPARAWQVWCSARRHWSRSREMRYPREGRRERTWSANQQRGATALDGPSESEMRASLRARACRERALAAVDSRARRRCEQGTATVTGSRAERRTMEEVEGWRP